MADSLIGNASNKYYGNAARLTNNHNLVKVMVEDEYDIPFWYDALSHYAPTYDFHFTPYSISESRSLTKGKNNVLAMADQFGRSFIGCIDSDCDYLLKDFDEKAYRTHSHKYIIPTFSYAIENLICEPHTLRKVCVSAAANNVDFNFVDFMKYLSVRVYPLVIWSAFLIRIGKPEIFPMTEWSGIFDKQNTNLYSMSDNEIIRKIEERIDCQIERISSQCREYIEEKEEFERHLVENGYINPEIACTFVRGHDLLEFISESLINPIVKKCVNKHKEVIDSSEASQSDKSNLKRHYTNVQHSHKDLLHANFYWHDYHPHASLVSDKIKYLFS